MTSTTPATAALDTTSTIEHRPAGQLSLAHWRHGERVIVSRDMPDRSHIVATLEIRRAGESDLSPGFSLTCSIWDAHGTWSGAACRRNGRDSDGGGADHDAILAALPGLAPFALVHLADLDGTPMHAHANGWYLYSGASARYELAHYSPSYRERLGDSHTRAADVLRMDPADLPANLDRQGFTNLVADQAERWRWEARDARILFNALRELARPNRSEN